MLWTKAAEVWLVIVFYGALNFETLMLEYLFCSLNSAFGASLNVEGHISV